MHKVLWTAALAALVALPASAQTFTQAHKSAPAPANSAQPLGPLTLRAARALAQSANPEIAGAVREVDAAGGALRQAGAIPNPELAATIEDQKRDTRETTIQMNQSIELGNKRGARLAVAGYAREKALAELAATRADVNAAVVTAFYDVLSAQEGQRLAQSTHGLAQRTTEATKKRVAAGKVSPVEETKARIAEAGAQVEMAQASASLAAARRRLASTWGASNASFERVDGELDSLPQLPPAQELVTRLERSPRLAQTRIEAERRAALTRLERARQIPDVTVSIGAKRDRQLGRDRAIFALSIPLPLFNRNQGNIIEATSRADRARDDVLAAQTNATTALLQAHDRWATAWREADLYAREILPGAQSAYDAAAKGFEFGKFAFLDVLDAQRTLIQAKGNHLSALSETHRAAAEVERLLGTPLNTQQQENP
ncbi:MAG: czcC2 [Rhodocyclales bacterium]|nr:czcC2 [Rhodocyclales bacterium]